jgi:uncharacterized protein (UPF0147 family)
MRNEQRSWRYQLPRQARRAYNQAYRQFRQAGKVSEKALRNASETVGALPVVSNLPMFRRRSIFQQWNDMMLGWWAAITSLSLPFISQRKSLGGRIADRMPDVSMPWVASRRAARQVAKKRNKALDRVEKEARQTQKRAEKAMDRMEDRSRETLKAVSRSMPSKGEINEIARRGQVIERSHEFVERMPFGERREMVIEKMPYKK